MAELILKPGREKSIIRHHPWIFSGAIDRVNGKPTLGSIVDVVSVKGEVLAKAAYSPNSNIIARIWTWDKNEVIDEKFLAQRVKAAISQRQNITNLINSNAIRVVHAESDGLPGLIVDRYSDTYVVQFLSAGVEYWRDHLINILPTYTGAHSIYERSDVDVRQLEGLPARSGILFGDIGENKIIIQENDIKFYVDIVSGHKTGFYIDQRDNRFFARNLSRGLKILDCFSYTGGFALNTLAGGAESITVVDSSETALSIARENIILNKLPLKNVDFVEQDIFKYLRYLRDTGETYDMIILDPPRFAPTASQVERAARAYKDINILALKILRPGGYLLTFSCSGGVSEELFQKIIAGAALDAEVDVKIIKRLQQAVDHPVALNFPEGAYLKGFVLHING